MLQSLIILNLRGVDCICVLYLLQSRVGSLQQFQYIKGGVLCHVSSSHGRLVAG